MAKKRVHIYYTGIVQGVGFRFTVEDLGLRSGVTGWVKNLPDRRVELLCEGEEKILVELLKEIRSGPLKHYIRNEEVSWSEPTGEFRDFHISFW